MFRIFMFGLVLALIFSLNEINCAPVVSSIEREEPSGHQLDFPNDNEIPGNVIPSDNRPVFTPGSRGFRPQSEGLLNRIVNFFQRVLGIGDQSRSGGDGGGSGGAPGNDPNSGGILNFIRRTFSGLINRLVNVFGGNGSNGGGQGGTPEVADFPLRRPQYEPLRNN